jgi:hypothetical protein
LRQKTGGDQPTLHELTHETGWPNLSPGIIAPRLGEVKRNSHLFSFIAGSAILSNLWATLTAQFVRGHDDGREAGQRPLGGVRLAE